MKPAWNARCAGVLSACVLAASAASGCGQAPSRPTATGGSAPGVRAASSGPAAPRVWSRFRQSREWDEVAVAPAAETTHFGGDYDVRVRVNPQARLAFSTLSAGGQLQVGTVLIAEHHTAARVGPLFVMEKIARNEWHFSVVDERGRLLTAADTSLCARCHLEAPADWVFPIIASATDSVR